MAYKTLVSIQTLETHLKDPKWAIVDCRFSLTNSEYGRRTYLETHIPGAIYAHLNEDLSGPIIPGKTGRHPLPPIPTFVNTLTNWGIDTSIQVVTYDDVGGSLAAARLWWMLRWLGHENVAVLDGGWQNWYRGGLPIRAGNETRSPREFTPLPRPEEVITTDEVETLRQDSNYCLLDSRTPERYSGKEETIDPLAGHIPGALSAPHLDNLDDDGQFLPPKELRNRFEKILNGVPPERTVFYCGSGVTAAQNILALSHSGLGNARLYAGSWSEWITAINRPIGKIPGV